MALDADAARSGRSTQRVAAAARARRCSEAAAAIMAVATERMVQAIEEITVNQGVDPRSAVLVGGGGAAGLNAVAIARRLGSRRVVIPQAGAVLSARGALMSDLTSEYAAAVLHRLRRVRPRARRRGARPSCARAASSSRERNGSGARRRDRVRRRGALPPSGMAARRAPARGAPRARPSTSRTSSRTSTRSTRRSTRCATSAPSSRSSTCARASTARCAAACDDTLALRAADTPRSGMRSVYFSGVGQGRRGDPAPRGDGARRAVRRPGDRRVVVHDDRAEPRRERRADGERQPRGATGQRSTADGRRGERASEAVELSMERRRTRAAARRRRRSR